MNGRRRGHHGWAAAFLRLGLVGAAGARADTLLPGAFSGGAYGAFANAQAGPVAVQVQIGRVATCHGRARAPTARPSPTRSTRSRPATAAACSRPAWSPARSR